MANMRSVYKRQLNLNMPLELMHKLDKLRVRFMQKTVGDTAITLLEESTRNVELTSDDLEQIAQEVKENERKRSHC